MLLKNRNQARQLATHSRNLDKPRRRHLQPRLRHLSPLGFCMHTLDKDPLYIPSEADHVRLRHFLAGHCHGELNDTSTQHLYSPLSPLRLCFLFPFFSLSRCRAHARLVVPPNDEINRVCVAKHVPRKSLDPFAHAILAQQSSDAAPFPAEEANNGVY